MTDEVANFTGKSIPNNAEEKDDDGEEAVNYAALMRKIRAELKAKDINDGDKLEVVVGKVNHEDLVNNQTKEVGEIEVETRSVFSVSTTNSDERSTSTPSEGSVELGECSCGHFGLSGSCNDCEDLNRIN